MTDARVFISGEPRCKFLRPLNIFCLTVQPNCDNVELLCLYTFLTTEIGTSGRVTVKLHMSTTEIGDAGSFGL